MSLKSEVLAILVEKKEQDLADVAAKHDALIAEVEALEEGPSGNEEVDALKAQIASMQEAADALKASEDEEDLDQNAKIEAAQVFKDKILAALNG